MLPNCLRLRLFFRTEGPNPQIAGNLISEENIPGPESPGDSADWFPEDATALVWSGDDAYIASAILGALNENDLHVRREMQDGVTSLFVLPAEQTRAREIIREIVESSAPEWLPSSIPS